MQKEMKSCGALPQQMVFGGRVTGHGMLSYRSPDNH
jgi:hypothetical protein